MYLRQGAVVDNAGLGGAWLAPAEAAGWPPGPCSTSFTRQSGSPQPGGAMSNEPDTDGLWTTIHDPGDMPTRNVWKTADRRDDGTPGVTPIVRTRISAGQRVLVYGGPVETQGVEMWELIDGETFGWISEMQLDSVPDGGL